MWNRLIMGKLTKLQVDNLKEPGRYGDGDGLWLHIGPTGAKSWVLRYSRNKRAREMGLGPVSLFSLKEARERAREARRLLYDGIDPLDQRRAEREAAQLDAARGVSFAEAAERYIGAHEAGWKNPKHRQQWRNTLTTYAFPVMGELPVAEIDTGLVLKVLEPIWQEKAETASRLRGRIESILDWATARKLRNGENPARWKGHLDTLLPARSKVQTVKHHEALPYAEIGGFMAELREKDGIAARALEFCILTAARSGEVIKARWDEIDLDTGLWVLPPERMKARREHRVPLSERAVEILREMRSLGSDWVFPGQREGKPLSNMAMLMQLRRMGREDLTTHGFRSSFRDWAAERTAYPHEVCEMALGHRVGSAVERAYRRGDMFDKRRRLMKDWSRFCTSQHGGNQVIPFNG